MIWAKRPGTASGTKMLVSIDDAQAREIGNLNEQMLINLGNVAPGVHRFRLTAITVYSIDGLGKPTRINDGTAECSGQFVVQAYQTYYTVGVLTADTKLFQCQIQ